MKNMFYRWKDLVEKILSHVQCTLVMILSAGVRKKIVFVSIVVFSVPLQVSIAQEQPRLLAMSDSCQVHPPQNIIRPREAAAPGAAVVRLAYVIPSNRAEQTNGVVNFQRMIKAGQQWFSDQIEQNGFDRKTFTVETEADGVTPLIHVVHVPETDEFLRGSGDGLVIWDRTMTAASNAGISLWATGEVWVLIPELHLMSPDGRVTGDVALGAGYGTSNLPGLAMIGSKALALFDLAVLTDDTPYDGKVFPALGPYPMRQDVTFAWFEGTTLSSAASSWVGALFHETGHAFGLAHDFRHDNNFHGNLMGNGLRGMRGSLYPERYPADYTRLGYTAAGILNLSHFFNHSKIETPAPLVSHADPGLVIPQQGLAHIAFNTSDPDSLGLAHLRYNGDAVAELVLAGTDADTAFAVPFFTPGAANSYTLVVHDKQGNVAYQDIQLNVAAGYNQGPVPFIRINPPVPGINQAITLDASQSYDPDNTASSLQNVWDLNGDGEFDTDPITDKILQYQYENPGNYLIRLTVIDPAGGQVTSTPVSIKIPGEKKIAIKAFTLIDADRDKSMGELKDNMEIDLAAWGGKTFSVRAETSPCDIKFVRFDISGPIAHQQTERKRPYTLFGEYHHGNIAGRKLFAGEYKLTATPYGPAGKGIARTISFKAVRASIQGLTLIDPQTDQDITKLNDGDAIDLAALGIKMLNIRADITNDRITKVAFDLRGPVSFRRLDKQPPFSLFGDYNGDYKGGKLLAGDYTMKVVPYTGDAVGTALRISFSVTGGGAITGFTLVDATSDQTLGALGDGGIIDLSLLQGHKLSIQAESQPQYLDKVSFILQGPTGFRNTEWFYPYTLFGDKTGEGGAPDYFGAMLVPGNYALEAIPFYGGVKGGSRTINFVVTTATPSFTDLKVTVFPVPASGIINVVHGPQTLHMYMTLTDFGGNVLIKRPFSENPVEQLDVSQFTTGLYYLTITSPNGIQVIRIPIE